MPLPQPTIEYNPQTLGPLDQLGKVMALKNAAQESQVRAEQLKASQLENQQRETALRDQQTVMQTLAQNGGDIGAALPQLAGKVTPQTYMGLAKAHYETREAALKMSNEKLANDKSRNDNLLGLIDQVKQLPPDQYAQQWPQIAQRAVQIKPELQGQVDPAKPIPQEQLSQMQLGIQAHSTIQDQVLKDRADKRAQAESEAKLPGEKADSEMKVSEAAMMKQFGAMKPEMRDSKYIALQQHKTLGQPISVGDQAFMKAYEKQKTLSAVTTFNLQGGNTQFAGNDPSVQAVAEGRMKIGDVLTPRTPLPVRKQFLAAVQQANPNFDSRDYDVEKGVMKDFTSGASAKNLTAFNTAIAHATQLQQAADALDNGDMPTLNKLGNALGYQFGSDKMTNFNVIKNALSGEVSKVFKGGQATDAEIRQVEEPFSSANSPAQLKGAIQNAIHLMNSKRDALKQQYESGKKAQPNFEGSSGSDPFSQFGGKAR